MSDNVRTDPANLPGNTEVHTEVDFWIEMEDVLARAKEVAEHVQARTDKVLGEQPAA
jgi:hypothetical protein